MRPEWLGDEVVATGLDGAEARVYCKVQPIVDGGLPNRFLVRFTSISGSAAALIQSWLEPGAA